MNNLKNSQNRGPENTVPENTLDSFSGFPLTEAIWPVLKGFVIRALQDPWRRKASLRDHSALEALQLSLVMHHE